MKTLLLAIFNIIALQSHDKLVNSIWKSKVADGCFDKIELGLNHHTYSYSCEMQYTYQGVYSISKDTLIIKSKDDAHGKKGATYFKIKYLIYKNGLIPIISSTFTKGSLKETKIKFDRENIYKRLK
ncbi:MAG: hypothetical protein H7289_02435 [Mucilaginibacter sp.]|nr:hypothetical protein [Mucilaginibacter sp.]